AAATGALAGDTRLVRQLSDNAVFQISTIVSFEESAGRRDWPRALLPPRPPLSFAGRRGLSSGARRIVFERCEGFDGRPAG
ncbi:hypothetical protein LAN32_26335, partial [Mycobacterium tuberculosis]|nr:hypothetical protein [Mycobacterium tuberculosis]